MKIGSNARQKQIRAFNKEVSRAEKIEDVSSWLEKLDQYHIFALPYISGMQAKESLLNKAKNELARAQQNGSADCVSEAQDALSGWTHIKNSGVYPADITSGNRSCPAFTLSELKHRDK